MNITPRNSTLYKATERGIFTFAPDLDLQGLVLNSAQDASDRNGGVSHHRKLDKSGYVYRGRSYGLAAAVGLETNFEPPATSYEFEETGLLAETSCIRNHTAEYELVPFDLGLTLQVYNAVGYLANGLGTIFAAAALTDESAFAIAADGVNGSNYVAFATLKGADSVYAKLEHLQCEVRFTPTQFGVRVNTTAQTIDVSPESSAEPFSNMDELGGRLMRLIGKLGSALSTTCWQSVMGEVFMNNIINVESFMGPSDETTFTAVGMSLDSIIDSCLEAISAAQMQVLQDTQTVQASTQSVAFVFGALSFQLAILGVSTLVTIVYATECIRTRFWTLAATLNFMDMKSTVVATSAGGTDIAKRANRKAAPMRAGKRPPQYGDFKVVAQDADSGHELLVVTSEAYELVPYGTRELTT